MVETGETAPFGPNRLTVAIEPHHTRRGPALQSIRRRKPVVARFVGAAGCVGGSLILVEIAGRTVLLECGRRPGEARFPESALPRLDSVGAVIISHAHNDHAGWLGELLSRGYRGPVVTTPATRDLLGVQLQDSARRRWQAQRESAAVDGAAPAPPTGSPGDPGEFVAVGYGQSTDLAGGVRVTFGDAGHLLGSATVLLEWDGESPGRVFYSGDVGRAVQPFFCLPPSYPAADLVISESTYGDREVSTYEEAVDQLGGLIEETVDDGGRVLIPVFSLGRTQVLLAALTRLWGAAPPAPVWVDSPIAQAYSEVYRQHCHSLQPGVGDWEGAARYVTTDAQSVDLVHGTRPAIILAAGGMCDGARARRHLKATIDDPRCRVVLVSHQAPGTLGRRLLERGPTVRFDGRVWNKWAKISCLAGFSAHADRAELEQLIRPAAAAGSPVRLVHGDRPVSQALAERLTRRGCPDVAVPVAGSAFELP
jgi:metallo-beta-lactamase family protein